ncbi:MAG: hypothetical protein WCY08_15385 [Rhodocyclaceae bacterium]
MDDWMDSIGPAVGAFDAIRWMIALEEILLLRRLMELGGFLWKLKWSG